MTNVVSLAQLDPAGARLALLDYGALVGYPSGRLGMLFFAHEGKETWTQTLSQAHPAILGLGWAALEDGRVPRHWNDETAAKSAEKEKGKENMPVLDPTKTLEPGAYPAIVTEVEQVTSKFEDREVEQIRLQFVVLDDNLQKTDEEIRGYCSAKWGNRCKLTEWAKNILGKKCPSSTDPFDTDLLKNRKCDILVEEVKTKQGMLTSKVTGVYPFKTVSTRVREEDEEDETAT